ncbi:MAG TPA: serine/threonine-protein kinase [Gemmataceae bacterium]|nr:serine/threonine-protein kinase [Gemmataceae bacterium]
MATPGRSSDKKSKNLIPVVAMDNSAAASDPTATEITRDPPLPPLRGVARPNGSSPQTQIVPMDAAALQPWSEYSIAFAKQAVPSTDKPTEMGAQNSEPIAVALGAPAARSVPPELSEIGPYRIIELIGEGGMGLVYRAVDKYLQRIVALKMMRPHVAQDERAWKLFLTEARAAAALKDDRIATIYNFQEIDGQFCLAMELLKGEPLEGRLRRGRVPLPLALWIIREAALGLSVAHKAGFIHRDIKPANLWLETATGTLPEIDRFEELRPDEMKPLKNPPYLRVKILDFGLVRLEQDDGTWRKRNSIVGTPAYMAPEQAAGQTADARSDLFSLGVVFFRLLTGRLPFEAESPLEILTAVASEVAPPVTEFNEGIPLPVAALVQQLLCRNPNDRLQSADALVEAINEIEQQLFAAPAPPAASRKRGMPVWAMSAGVIVAGVAFGLGWYLWNQHNQAREPVRLTASQPTAAVLTPREAAQLVGDKITVEFVVGSIWRSGEQVYVYEEAPKANEPSFRLALSKRIITTMLKRGAHWPEVLFGTTLRVHGAVYRVGSCAEILVSDVDQFDKILYAEAPEPKKIEHASKDDGEQPVGPTPDKPRAPNDKEPKELTDSIEEAAKKILAPFGKK